MKHDVDVQPGDAFLAIDTTESFRESVRRE